MDYIKDLLIFEKVGNIHEPPWNNKGILSCLIRSMPNKKD